jgi:hypothetical protein
MDIEFFCEEALETIEVPVCDVQALIDLVEEHGYEDSDGTIYDFNDARVEYGRKVVIYLNAPEETVE